VKIIRLTAENVKRLKAVEIEPDGTVQVITGRNAQGKTSVLDAIWLALGGGAASRETSRPIRDGEDEAYVLLDLGDLIVRRTWTGGEKSTLTVTAPDGAKYSSPQGVLDALVGRLSFDPLAFTRLAERDQLRALLDVVELPFDPAELERRRLGLFDQRTDIGRDVKRLRGHLASVQAPPEGTPDVEVSVGELVGKLSALESLDARHDRAKSAVEIATATVDRIRLELRDAEDVLADARLNLDQVWPDRSDIEAVRAQIASAEETNRNVRALQELARVAADLAMAEAQYEEQSAAIAALDEERSKAIAGAAFPIDGLGFTDEGVTYNGVPFSQASSAEQIRVSLAMAMALNPKLRVIRIIDGSLLDEENMRLIAEAAAEHDFQVWIEKVADGSGVGVTIEDGEVAA
jgi:DNA repair exonuclease SbcCD ATPase subunit